MEAPPRENVNYYYYLNLLQKEERINRFQKAIASIVPGKKVVEIGCGVGTYSFFAAAAGASHVYSIEKSEIIRVAQRLARINGLEDKITFLHGESTKVSLPEKCDVLILENFSSLFVRRRIEEFIRDALSRHLTAEAIVVPSSVSYSAVPVDSEKDWKRCSYFEKEKTLRYGIEWGLLREAMLENPHVHRLDKGTSLASPARFLKMDLRQEQPLLFDEVMKFTINRPGKIYGLGAWFDLHLAPGIRLSNSVEEKDTTWSQVFFPLRDPLPVVQGDEVTCRIACTRGKGDGDIWWAWQAAAPSGTADHTSFKGIPFWPGEFD